MTGIPGVSWAECERRFHVSCKASDENQFCVGTESIRVSVGQLIQRHGRAEMWESVSVYAHAEDHSEKLSYGGSIAMPLGYRKARVRRMRGRKTDQDETKAPCEPETDGN